MLGMMPPIGCGILCSLTIVVIRLFIGYGDKQGKPEDGKPHVASQDAKVEEVAKTGE